MVWLSILNNEAFLVAAQTLIIITGSMLLGILLSYLNSGGTRSKLEDLTLSLDQEKRQSEELRSQVRQISQIRTQLQSEIDELKVKSDSQLKTIYDQQQYHYSREAEQKNQKATIDGLNATIDSYQHRLRIIEEELEKTTISVVKPKKPNSIPAVRANYEHVSKLLGRQVTENDLTIIVGIGPKTAALLQANGIKDWEGLAAASPDTLQKLLADAGGIYKSQDSTHWAKQAFMASQGEWRKLRVFQETLRKSE